MYEISLEQARYFRKAEIRKVIQLRKGCKHHRFQKVVDTTSQQEMFVCHSCLRWWYITEPHPSVGNPALERFLYPCEHIFLRTLPGTLTKNECLECDEVIDKSTIATAWKNVRETAKKVSSTIKSQFVEQPKQPIRFIWDPEEYGNKCWGIEYH